MPFVSANAPMFDGVIFDLDGTLTVNNLDFGEIRREIGMTDSTPILEYMEMVGPEEQNRIRGILEKHERRAAETAELNEGAKQVLGHIAAEGLKTALLTRNSQESADTVMRRHGLAFDVVIARDDAEPKPSPQPVLLIAERLGVAAERLLMVGDYKFDIMSGQAAGCKTALLLVRPVPDEIAPDYVIDSLHELIPILSDGHAGREVAAV